MQFAPTVPSTLARLLEAMDTERMLIATRTLCSEAFAGRRVGTQGHRLATEWLGAQFRHAGRETRLEAFPLTAPVLEVTTPLELELLAPDGRSKRALARRTEFCEHPRSTSHAGLLEGKGVRLSTDASPQQAWVILESVPGGEAFADLATRLAAEGAIGLLAPLYANTQGYLGKRIMAGPPVALPVLSVRADLLALLEDTRVRARVSVTSRQGQGHNVLAWREGTEQAWETAPLLVSAHYDAVGDDPGGPRLPGATDNAAAVAVLLELAHLLEQSPTPPKRPIHLVAFDAEEVGAQGSRWAAAR